MSRKSTSSFLQDSTKALYQPWKEEAFRADEYVQAMNWLQRHLYRALLHSAFVCSERPYLPVDDSRLWVLAGCESLEMWELNKTAILPRFIPVIVKGQKLLSQKHVLEDWQRMQEALESRREHARKAGKASASKRSRVKARQSDESLGVESQPELNTSQHELNTNELDSNTSQPNSTNVTKLNGTELNVTNVTQRNRTDLTNPPSLASRSDGRMLNTPNSKSAGQDRASAGRENLTGWKLEFQQKIQRAAADKDEPVVFSVPLPAKLFDGVERMAETCGMDSAQEAVVEWLEARSFAGLINPNTAWDKMSEEIYGFVQ